MRKILVEAEKLLRKKKVPEIKNSIQILFQESFHHSSMNNLPAQIRQFKRNIKMRSLHYPIQYICRSWPFRQLDLKLQRPVLIPRFETEYLISLIHSKINEKYDTQQIKHLSFVEYGCGSGAIGLSLIKECGIYGKMIDIDPKCVKLTEINAHRNKCSSDLFQIIEGDMRDNLNFMDQCQIIVSNPPYLSEEHYQRQLKKQVKHFEDKKALVGGLDGLEYIRLLLEKWDSKQEKGLLFIEYDGRQLSDELSWVNQFVEKDQYGKRRFIILEK